VGTIYLILLVFAAICFGWAAFAVTSPPRVNLTAFGLLLATLAWLTRVL
jgi:hypothetical protein